MNLAVAGFWGCGSSAWRGAVPLPTRQLDHGFHLKVPDVVQNLGAGEILGSDELAADGATGIDDVSFGGTGGIECVIRLL